MKGRVRLFALARQRSGNGAPGSLKGIFKRFCDEERGLSRALDRDHGGGARQDWTVYLTSRPSLEYDVNDASTASRVRPCEAAQRGQRRHGVLRGGICGGQGERGGGVFLREGWVANPYLDLALLVAFSFLFPFSFPSFSFPFPFFFSFFSRVAREKNRPITATMKKRPHCYCY